MWRMLLVAAPDWFIQPSSPSLRNNFCFNQPLQSATEHNASAEYTALNPKNKLRSAFYDNHFLTDSEANPPPTFLAEATTLAPKLACTYTSWLTSPRLL